jgi:hypothetical protein
VDGNPILPPTWTLADAALSFEEMPQGLHWVHPIADDLQDGQHWHGQGHASHPEPEHQRQDDQHGVPWGLIICLLLGFRAGMHSLLRAAARTQ